MRLLNFIYIKYIKISFLGILGSSLCLLTTPLWAVCGDGLIDTDINGVATELCDLGAYNDNNPDSLSGCDTNCKTKANGWRCTNSIADWKARAQTDSRGLKNLFIKLAQQSKQNLITSTNCEPTGRLSNMQPCKNYIKDLYEFKRLNTNNSINTSAKVRCMYEGDTTPSAIKFIDPFNNNFYEVNCGEDNPNNPAVPVPASAG